MPRHQTIKRTRIAFAGVTFSAPTMEMEGYLPGGAPRIHYTVPVNILRKIIAAGNIGVCFENMHDSGRRVSSPSEVERELRRGERPYACYISSDDPRKLRYCLCLSIHYEITEGQEPTQIQSKDIDLIARAIRAHNTASKHEAGTQAQQPSNDASSVELVDGNRYVVLRNISGILRVYKVRADARLMHVTEWPEGLA